jgi:hypothetical protein
MATYPLGQLRMDQLEELAELVPFDAALRLHHQEVTDRAGAQYVDVR